MTLIPKLPKTLAKVSLTVMLAAVTIGATAQQRAPSTSSTSSQGVPTALPGINNSLAGQGREICAQLASRSSLDRAMSAKPSPIDNRLVVFPYHESGLYTLHTSFGVHTHLELGKDERIVAAYINDQTLYEQKVVESTRRDVFLRPLVKGAVGSLTLITDKRRYQVELYEVSECPGVNRFQRASWHYGDSMWTAPADDAQSLAAAPPQAQGPTGAAGAAPLSVLEPGMASNRVDVSRLNLEYQIEGSTAIKPMRVFDDGTRTWIQFENNMALRPAIFVVNEEGKGEPVEYIPDGNTFILARTFTHGLLLKLGKQEVRVRNVAKSRCSMFDRACKDVRITNINSIQSE